MSEHTSTPPIHLPGKGKLSGLTSRRVLGVPVLYLALVAVGVLAFYAVRLKPKPDTTPAATDDSAVAPAPAGEVSPDMPLGTVYAPTPVADVSTAGNSSIDSNQEWLTRGVQFLGDKGVGAGVAQGALQTYLDGGALSTVQGSYRDQVVRELGLPPDGARVTGLDLASAVNPRRSLGYARYVPPGSSGANGAPFVIYELFDDQTKRLVTAAEWATKAGSTPTTNVDKSTIDAYKTWN